MASNALKQLIADADWGELDYFLIDHAKDGEMLQFSAEKASFTNVDKVEV